MTETPSRTDTVPNAAEDSSLSEVLPVRRDWAVVQLTCLESLRDVMQAWAALTPYVKGN